MPVELYNLIVWCTGVSDCPTSLTDRCEVSGDDHLKILSLCQDIMYLASKGKQQTPKSLVLGLTLRHLTGSSQLVKLLSSRGHCASWDIIHRFESSLAQVQLLSADDVPRQFAKKKPNYSYMGQY